MRPEKSGVPRVPGVPANAHAGLRRNTRKNARVPGVPKAPKTLSSSNAGNTWNTSPKPRVPSENPHGYWAEHREHLGTRDLKVGLAKNGKNPPPDAAETPVDAPGPLTPAERQRRHRAKVKAAAAAHALTAAGNLLPENMRLVRQVERLAQEITEHKAKAQQSAAQIQQLQQDLGADRQRLQALRAMLRATLPRLTPAPAKQLRHALKEAGFIEWLDTG